MLTRLYRHGPSRQSISKGYVVAGPAPENIVRQVLGERAARPGPITARAAPHQPHVIRLETGMTSLHTFRAREALFKELAGSAAELAERVARAGGTLLPCAVGPADGGPWGPYLCDDLHRVQTSDPLETAAYCNLLRLELPTLIAASGRAALGPRGVQSGGSRRLAESTQHHPPHYLVSASPEHLARVTRCMQRDEGLPRLDLLDVYPAPGDDGSAAFVELRFNDGQAVLSTVRAQALLYQAMFICARRWARDEHLFQPADHRVLQRNRSRAVAEGMQARFESEKGGAGEPDGDGPRPGGRYRTARSALLTLVEKLRYELQVLEAEYEEVAPLVLGATLRRLGHAGLQNENDLLRTLHRQRPGEGPTRTAETLLRSPAAAGDLLRWNEQLFAAPAAEVRDWWEQFLRTPVEQRPAPDGRAATNFNTSRG
ncbi:MAG TPA: hypothetical protein VJ866_10000 [Pyrinomonadaceae bacterium]|nr:hypothetical protein [Pyrinomonadaceae bacterium]